LPWQTAYVLRPPMRSSENKLSMTLQSSQAPLRHRKLAAWCLPAAPIRCI